MKFKLDENLPLELAEDLAHLGHEVDTVYSEGLAGADDATVIQAARGADRILMTLDKGIASLLRYPVQGAWRYSTAPTGRSGSSVGSVFRPLTCCRFAGSGTRGT